MIFKFIHRSSRKSRFHTTIVHCDSCVHRADHFRDTATFCRKTRHFYVSIVSLAVLTRR